MTATAVLPIALTFRMPSPKFQLSGARLQPPRRTRQNRGAGSSPAHRPVTHRWRIPRTVDSDQHRAAAVVLA